MVVLTVILDPAGTTAGKGTRPMPQVVLSWGFCDPSRKVLHPLPTGFQLAVPVFVAVNVAVYCCPAAMFAATLSETVAFSVPGGGLSLNVAVSGWGGGLGTATGVPPAEPPPRQPTKREPAAGDMRQA